MKNFLTTILFVSVGFLIGTSSTFALSFFDTGGNPYNPLYIQIEQDPFQQQMQQDKAQSSANTQKENYLKSAYGLDSYYSCTSSLSDQSLGNPYSKASYLSGVQYCLERQSLNRRSAPQTIQVDEEKICESNFGAKRTKVSHSSDGSLICGCNSGYEWYEPRKGCFLPTPKAINMDEVCQNKGQDWKWDESSGGCVLIPKTPPPPAPTNNEICQDTYANSRWDGAKNNEGGLICDCKTGYEWNQAQTQCVSVPKTNSKETEATAIPTKTKDQECEESFGGNSLVVNGACGCKFGYTIGTNEGKTACVLETINEQKTAVEAPKIETPIQHKSFWARIKAWFGFN